MDRTTAASPLVSLFRPEGLLALMLVGEGLALVLALAPGRSGDPLVYFGLASLHVQWVSLMTLGAMYAGRRSLRPMPEWRLSLVLLGLLMVAAWVTGSLSWYLFPPESEPSLGRFMAKLTGIAWTLGLFGSALVLGAWRRQQLVVEVQASRFEALQARVRPHFLFNTLNTGAALVHAQPEQAERLLLDLADLFRAALSGPRELALADELSLALRYLDIESLRFGNRVDLHWEVPVELPDIRVPTLSIQPLVENAIRHGVEPSTQPCRIDVTVQCSPEEVRVLISNDLAPGRPAVRNPGHDVGLRSARERIAALTGGRGGVDTEIVEGRHVATVRLPRSSTDPGAQPPTMR